MSPHTNGSPQPRHQTYCQFTPFSSIWIELYQAFILSQTNYYRVLLSLQVKIITVILHHTLTYMFMCRKVSCVGANLSLIFHFKNIWHPFHIFIIHYHHERK